MVYIYDGKKMVHRKVKLHFLIGIILLLISFVSFSSFCLLKNYYNYFDNTKESAKFEVNQIDKLPHICKHDLIIEDEAKKDSIFLEYKLKADLFLSRGDFSGTPISGDIISLAARNAYDSTGILVPLELALSQCIWESSMGRRGKSPKNNPFNVGEYDNGTVRYFETTFDGVQAYYYLIANDYLRCRTVYELFEEYVNCKGDRYASEVNYEDMVSKEYYRIKRWLSKNYNK